MENFSLLGSLALQLHQDFVRIYYLMLPVFFALSIAIDWFRNPAGSPDFLGTLKRAIIATLLVAGFQEITGTILGLTSAIADRISDMQGLDEILRMAGEKCKTYTLSTTSLILGFNDMMLAVISFGSYIVLYIARYITVALYHFMWILLSILAPLLIALNLFRGTQAVTINLFRSMVEVASWKIVWAVLSAMITSLSFGNAYAADGNYLTVILLNFVIALAMLGTPMIVRSLVGGGLSSMSQTLGMGAAVAMLSAPQKVASAMRHAKTVASDTGGFAMHHAGGLGMKAMDSLHASNPNPPVLPPTLPPVGQAESVRPPSQSLQAPSPPPKKPS